MSAFEHHAFISYAHLDNQAPEAGEKGWVTRFHAALATRLSQRLGETAKIWRDDKLAANDIFADEIVDQFPKTALLISVLTPRYLKSEWCTRELETFARVADQHGGLRVGNINRIVKVAKTPLPPSSQVPAVIDRTLGINFFDDGVQPPEEFDPALGEQARQAFIRQVYALALSIADSLRELAGAQAADVASPASGPAPGPTVYLAECGRDLAALREQLAVDLRLHGCEVLPAEPLPADEEQFRAVVAPLLQRAQLAVHLVGRSGGRVPDGPTGQPVVALQNTLAALPRVAGAAAAAASATRAQQRLIWLPEGVTGERAEQQQFIDALLGDGQLQGGADLLRGDFEGFKTRVHQVLLRLRQPPPAAARPADAAAEAPVHLLMSEADRLAAVPLVKLLRGRGHAVSLPVFAGDAAQLRADNSLQVARSRAVVVLYGAADEAWKQHQLSDLRKQAALATAPAAGGAGPWLALLAPATPDKLLLQALAEPCTLDLLNGITEEALAPLLQALEGPR